MSEPKTVAVAVEEVVPGIRRWSIFDERIDFVSAAYAVTGEEETVLIDPLPLEPEALAGLEDVRASCSRVAATSAAHGVIGVSSG